MAEAKQDDTRDEVQYDLDVGDAQETEVEVEDKAAPAVEEEAAPEEEDRSSKEHEEYSASVQKRIDRLTKKMREAERQREEALRYAQNVQTEAEQIRQRMKSLDQGYMNEYGGRLTLEQQQAENELKRAVEMGDADATVAAQRKLTSLALSAQQYEVARQQQIARQQQEQAYAMQMAQNPQAYAPQQQQPAVQRPDPKAEDWAEKNTWFGQDEAMTFAAFGIHKKLVESEGFDPQSDEYYSELDKRIRREFPSKFSGSSNSRRPAQNVAGVSRTTSAGRKRVKLSPSQVAIARKLGVPLEEYAKYVKEN